MDATSTTTSSSPDIAAHSAPIVLVGTVGALTATIANVALWAGGRWAGVDFEVSPAVGDPFQVGIVLVILTTSMMFALGWAAFAQAARHSVRSARIVTVTAGIVAVVSAVAGPVPTALDAEAGALLAAMHLATGAIFVAAAAKMRPR